MLRTIPAAPAGPADYALAELGPTARSILEAARRILERYGWDALTLRRIAAEAGQTKSLIIYHFGGKDGLLAALVDFLWHEEDLNLVARLADLPNAPAERARALVDVHHLLALDTVNYSTYFALLPHILHNTAARRRHAELNDTYRSLGVTAITSPALDPAERLALASLLLAVDEGAGTLVQLDPHGFDHEAVFGLLQHLVALRLEPGERLDRRADESPGPRLPADHAVPGRGACQTPPDDFALPDPTSTLPPVARRLLDGAVRVFLRGGLEKVTFEAVAAASGEPSSATTYHYGEKRNLIIALHDVLLLRAHRTALRELRRAAAAATVAHPFATLPLGTRDVLRVFRTLYDFLPLILRDEELRRHQVAFLDWLRRAASAVCESQGLRCEPAFIDLTLAVLYGLPLQLIIDRDGLAAQPVLEMWGDLVSVYSR